MGSHGAGVPRDSIALQWLDIRRRPDNLERLSLNWRVISPSGWVNCPTWGGHHEHNGVPSVILPLLQEGHIGIVSSVNPAPEMAKRLADMGFIPGARIQMVRSGNPCIVRVDDTSVGLGTRGATYVELHDCDPS